MHLYMKQASQKSKYICLIMLHPDSDSFFFNYRERILLKLFKFEIQ